MTGSGGKCDGFSQREKRKERKGMMDSGGKCDGFSQKEKRKERKGVTGLGFIAYLQFCGFHLLNRPC